MNTTGPGTSIDLDMRVFILKKHQDWKAQLDIKQKTKDKKLLISCPIPSVAYHLPSTASSRDMEAYLTLTSAVT